MNSFDDLIRDSSSAPSLPLGFVDRVMQRIAFLEERKKLRRLFFAAIITAVCILLLSHFVSLVVLEYLEGSANAILSLLSVEPSLLFTSAGWGALLESPFFGHALMATVIAISAVLFEFSAIRTWNSLPHIAHAS
jgi:hypothetical protein